MPHAKPHFLSQQRDRPEWIWTTQFEEISVTDNRVLEQEYLHCDRAPQGQKQRHFKAKENSRHLFFRHHILLDSHKEQAIQAVVAERDPV